MTTRDEEVKAIIEEAAREACHFMNGGENSKVDEEIADLVYNRMLASPPPAMVDLLKPPENVAAPSDQPGPPPPEMVMAGDGAVEGKYGVIRASKKEFHSNEPVFLLRSTDPFTVDTIRYYARECEEAGCTPDHVSACMGHARRILEWQRANPALVKKLPN